MSSMSAAAPRRGDPETRPPRSDVAAIELALAALVTARPTALEHELAELRESWIARAS